MTTIALNARSAHTAAHRSFLTNLAAHFADLRDGARDGRAIQTRYETLARMSQSELATSGMTRSDIYRAALVGRPV